jgi:hypothetical protein
MDRGVIFLFGNNVNQDSITTYENIKRNLQELESVEERKHYIAKYIDMITSDDLRKYNISKTDAEDIKKALKKIYELNDKDLSKYRRKILIEVEK